MLRHLELAFIRVHTLYHAGQAPIYGAWLQEELARHGYEIGPGTLYPMLHGLERDGLLARCESHIDDRPVKCYSLTSEGERVLEQARERAWELVREIGRATSYP